MPLRSGLGRWRLGNNSRPKAPIKDNLSSYINGLWYPSLSLSLPQIFTHPSIPSLLPQTITMVRFYPPVLLYAELDQ